MDQKGFGILEFVVSMGISIILLGVVSITIMQGVKLNKKIEVHTQTAIVEMSLFHKIINNETLIKNLNLDADPSLIKCFKGVGTNCLNYSQGKSKKISISQGGILKQFVGLASSCDTLSKKCPIEQKLSYSILCDKNSKCNGINIKVDVFLHAISQSAPPHLLSKKSSSIFVSSNKLYDQPPLAVNNCTNGSIKAININTGEAECSKPLPLITCDGLPVTGVGAGSCGSPIPFNDFCSLDFSTDNFYVSEGGKFNGTKLGWNSDGSKTYRLSYSCTSDRPKIYDSVSGFFYFNQPESNQGAFGVLPANYSQGPITIQCSAEGFNLSGKSISKCEAQFVYGLKPSASTSPSSSGGSGTSNPTSSVSVIAEGNGGLISTAVQ